MARDATSQATSGRSSLDAVFTGIVRERGTVVSVEGGGDGMRLVIEAPATAGRRRSATPSRSTASTSRRPRSSTGAIDVHRRPRDARAHDARTPRARRRGQPRAGAARGRSARRALRPGPRRRRRRASARSSARASALRVCVRDAARPAPLLSSRRARSPCRASRSPSPRSTTTTFGVALIPHTLADTTLGSDRRGDELNLEVDVLGKYVERLIARRIPSSA